MARSSVKFKDTVAAYESLSAEAAKGEFDRSICSWARSPISSTP